MVIGLAKDKNIEGIVHALTALKPSLIVCVEPDPNRLGSRGRAASEVAAAFNGAVVSSVTMATAKSQSSWDRDEAGYGAPRVCTVGGIAEAFSIVTTWAQQVRSAKDDIVAAEAPLVCVTGSNHTVGAAINAL
jgi:hypothetical protein